MEGLGIDLKMLLAQLVNFGAIFFLLVWLLKKPLERVIRERSELIEKSVTNAAELEKRLTKIEAERQELVAQARQEADELIAKGQEIAVELQKKATATARQEAEAIIARAQAATAKEEERLLQSLSDRIRETVRASLAESFKEIPTAERQKAADAAIKELLKER